MRIFITGATGYLGTALVHELISAGHGVLGLCRSEDKAAALLAAGADPHRGSLDDLASLAAACANVDAVIHLGFNHDFSRFVENCENDRRAIRALGTALAGSQRPLIVTSVTGISDLKPGRPERETDRPLSSQVRPRAASEEAAAELVANGVQATVIRLPQVHDVDRQGLVSYAIAMLRGKGVFPYVGDGLNRWPAVHVGDAARLFRRAVEAPRPGATLHAVAEEGVPMREIAEAVARRLGMVARSVTAPQAEDYLGWLAHLAAMDIVVSSDETRRLMDWRPTGPGLIDDLNRLRAVAA
jgi:nucleoside-diphosphate-sugar epimerase